MDIVDNDMVLKTLHTEYGAIPGPGSKVRTTICVHINVLYINLPYNLFTDLSPNVVNFVSDW